MKSMLRRIVALSTIVALAAVTTLAHAACPDKPLRLVIPLPSGGPADTLGRQLARVLSPSPGQSVVVENKAGGNCARPGTIEGGRHAGVRTTITCRGAIE